jgi:hypothetical protein
MPPSKQAANRPWWTTVKDAFLLLALMAFALALCSLTQRCENSMNAGKECSPCKTDEDCNKGLTCSSFTYKNGASHDRCVGEVRKHCPL